MKSIIIVPAYNESGNIENTIKNIKTSCSDFDYVIINDCSTDNTLEKCKKNHFNYIDLPINLGIGGAVQAGYRYAYHKGYDYAVQFDGDGQHDAKYLDEMRDIIIDSKADMVIGSRFIKKEGFQSSKLRRFGINYFSNLIKIITGKKITDPTSGMRLINRRLMKEFAYSYPKDYPEPESTVTALKKGYQVTEMPVVMKERLEGKSSINISAGAYYMIKVSLAIIVAGIKK